MLKLTLKPGEYIDIGENIRIIFSGGSANNIHLLVDAPRELNIARSSAVQKEETGYYKEKGISEEAKREIREILRREKQEEKDKRDENKKTVAPKATAAALKRKGSVYVVSHR